MADMNSNLMRLYQSNWSRLRRVSRSNRGHSCPFLLSASDAYSVAPIKVMFVGQQTCGWDRLSALGKAPVRELMQWHRTDGDGHKWSRTPFWRAVHEVAGALGVPERGFVWANLVKMDRLRKRLRGSHEDRLGSIGLFPEEVRLLSPDVVVFFTGPAYDDRLVITFPGARLLPVKSMSSNAIVRVVHCGLPTATFRTYHPGYLRRSNQWSVLQRLVKEIRSVG